MFEAPYGPYDPSDKNGFSYETVSKRWPVILDGIIERFGQVIDNLSLQAQNNGSVDASDPEIIQLRVQEGGKILEQIRCLKDRINEDLEMELIVDDGETHIAAYNSELTRLALMSKNSWFTAPWLFAECYLYRLLRSYFSRSLQWRNYDPFFAPKLKSLKKSSESIYEIATTMRGLEASKHVFGSDSDKVELLFEDMMQMSLWGNASDLSRFVNYSLSDVQVPQYFGKVSNREFILKNDQKEIWQALKNMKHERIDIALDNAGFELFTDLVFADFLVTFTPHVSRVVFHPKLIPWFVSDVTPLDFKSTITSLFDASFLPPPQSNCSARQDLTHLVTRWNKYLEDQVFMLSVPADLPIGGSYAKQCEMADFWTSPWPYWDMQTRAIDLWEWFGSSGMVIFKGDLHYRKLTGDIQWPIYTPFSSAIGPVAGAFSLVSLCTSKSEVVVGIKPETAKDLDSRDDRWRVNGKYGLISFCPSAGL